MCSPLPCNGEWISKLQGYFVGFPSGTSGKEPVCQCRGCKRCGFDPWVEKIPWRRAWLQYSCLKNPLDRGVWHTTVHISTHARLHCTEKTLVTFLKRIYIFSCFFFFNLFRLHWLFVAASGSSCPVACGILVPWSEIKPTSSALEGGLLTTGPSGKSFLSVYINTHKSLQTGSVKAGVLLDESLLQYFIYHGKGDVLI